MLQSNTIAISRTPAVVTVSPTTRGAIVFIQLLIFVICSALAVAPANFFWKDTDLIYPCCAFLLVQSVWALWSWKRLAGTLIDPYAFVFLSALLFNAGQPLLEVFGLNKSGLLEGQFEPAVLARALFLVAAGLSGLHLGALFAMPRNAKAAAQHEGVEASVEKGRAIRTVGWSLLALSSIPAALQLKDALSLVLSSGYFALYQQEAKPAGLGSAQHILADFIVPGAMFLLAGSKGRRPLVILSVAILFGYALLLLFLGFRGASMMPLVGLAWFWDKRVRRLPRGVVTAVALILLVAVFPLVKETRLDPGAERTSTSYLINAYASIDNPVVAILSEMGKTMATIAHTIQLVPAEHSYELGAGYAYGFLTVLPSLFWERHPTVTHGIPSNWLIETVDPYQARQGGGMGFSFIAEAFLNFGSWGVPMMTLLLGYLFVSLCSWADRGSAARIALLATFLTYALFYARGDFADIPRALVWYAVLPYLASEGVHRMQTGSPRQIAT